MSKASDEMKKKMLEKAKKKQEEAEKRKLEQEEQERESARRELTQGDDFTITVKPMTLKLADPSQTFGQRKHLDELIGCFFEPEVAEAIKKDQGNRQRGWKSHLINELVKQYYKQQGML